MAGDHGSTFERKLAPGNKKSFQPGSERCCVQERDLVSGKREGRPYQIEDQKADKTFCSFINMIEWRQRKPISYLRKDEKRVSGLGRSPAGRHYHFLLAPPAKLDAASIETRWKCYVGHGAGFFTRKDIEELRKQKIFGPLVGELKLGGYAKVRPYDPKVDGVQYVMKSLTDPLNEEY